MTAQINIKIEKELKEKVDAIFDELGLSTTDAVRIFFKKVVRESGIPFRMRAKNEIAWNDLNEETKEAMLLEPDNENTILITSVEQYKELEKTGELDKYRFVKYADDNLSFKCLNI